MNRLARAGLAVAAGAGIVLTASPAMAGGGAPAEDGGGEWVPVEDVIPGYYDPVDVAACGGTVTVETGDVREVEVRDTLLADGTLVRDYRGGYTLDLTRDDGAMIDELDVSGDAREVVSPDGGSAEVTLEGPSFISPFPGEEPFFDAEGLPYLTYFTDGEVTLTITADLETLATTSLTADIDARLIDLCTWFDDDHDGGGERRAAHDDGRDHGHGDDSR